jgi:hypothetical protein
MTEPPIRIDRGELFDPAVDKALARERAGRERIIADAPPVSALRRLLLNSMFYLPLAAVLGAFVTWVLIEPHISDQPIVGGEIVLVNTEPFDVRRGVIALTVGAHEVLVDPTFVKFEPGGHGEPPLASTDDLHTGARIEAVGLRYGHRLIATAIRPTDDPASRGEVDRRWWPLALMFPMTAALIAFGLLLSEGLTTRNWIRMIERTLLGSFLATLFTFLAYLPAGLLIAARDLVQNAQHQEGLVTIRDLGTVSFVVFAGFRSAAWACMGAAAGFGMNLVRSTRTQLRNSVIGGALGGALGGLFFDPIDRWASSSMFFSAATSRCVGTLAVGLSIGIFVALVERLGREAWLRVRTGPLAGKSFILYKTPTILGSSPQSDVYLYKDADIDPSHVAIHRVGTVYEIEDLGTRMGTSVVGTKIRRRRLVSGDQIAIGSTILDFEERQKRTPAA